MTASQPIHTRKSPIAYRRFSATDLRRIVELLADEYEVGQSTGSRVRLSINITYTDESSYELTDARILPTDDPFSKPISEIQVNCVLPDERRISLTLLHTEYEGGTKNTLVVTGPDLTWVNGVTGRIMDLVAACEKQPRRHRPVFLVSLGLSIIYSLTLVWLIYKYGSPPSSVWYQLLLGIIFGLVFLTFLGILLDSLARRMWPTVELQTGPPHTHAPARLRSRMWIGLSVFLFPLLLAIPGLLPSPSQAPPKDGPIASSGMSSANPLEVQATSQKQRLTHGDVQLVVARIRNKGSTILQGVLVSIEARGFKIENPDRTIRFMHEQQEKTEEFKIPIDKEVPRGRYEISLSASAWLPPSQPVTVRTSVGFLVE